MNPILRIAAAAVLATYVAPKLVNRFVVVETTGGDAARNQAVIIGLTAVITTGIYTVLGMALGGEEKIEVKT